MNTREVNNLDLRGIELARCAPATDDRNTARQALPNQRRLGRHAIHAIDNGIERLLKRAIRCVAAEEFGTNGDPAVGINRAHALSHHLGFWPSDSLRHCMQLSVRVRHAHIIAIHQRERPHSGSRQRFHRP